MRAREVQLRSFLDSSSGCSNCSSEPWRLTRLCSCCFSNRGEFVFEWIRAVNECEHFDAKEFGSGIYD